MHLSLLLENTCATGIITRLVHCNTDFMGLLFFCISSICQNLQACLRMQDALMEHQRSLDLRIYYEQVATVRSSLFHNCQLPSLVISVAFMARIKGNVKVRILTWELLQYTVTVQAIQVIVILPERRIYALQHKTLVVLQHNVQTLLIIGYKVVLLAEGAAGIVSLQPSHCCARLLNQLNQMTLHSKQVAHTYIYIQYLGVNNYCGAVHKRT